MSYTDVKYKFKKIGKNVQLGKNIYFRYPEKIEIGDNVIIDDFSYFSTSLVIEDYVHISPFCSVIGGIKSKLVMREFSGLSAGCRIICGSDDYSGIGLTNPTVTKKYRIKSKSTTIEIGRHGVLGTNCVVHPGVKIGEGAAAGSMSLITKDVDPWWIYIGMPAKKFKKREKGKIVELEKQLKMDVI